MTGPRALTILLAIIGVGVLLCILFALVDIRGLWAIVTGIYLFAFSAVAILALLYPTAKADRRSRKAKRVSSSRQKREPPSSQG